MDEGGKSLAYLAAENGSWRCFKFLLDQMVKNNIPLEDHYLTHHLAYAVIEYGDLDGVRLMCNSIQDPSLLNRDLDGKGTTAVHIAAKIGSRDILHFLQSQGAKMDQEDKGGKTPLYYAIQCHSKQAVKFLLSERCKAKITAEALYLAFSLNLSDILKLLIESGAQVDVRSTHTHDTPLLLAIKNHDETAFNALVKMGASLDCTNHEGWTPTLLASDTGQYTILEAILRLGYVDRSFYKGNHALHLACKKGHPECMKLLIQAGFSPHEPNGENKTAESLVQGSMSGLAALGVNDAFNTQLIRQLSTALEKGKLEDIQKGLHSLSANETISIQWENKKISGSLLHLILRIAPSTYVKPIVDRILQDPQLNIDLRDHRGCSYAHLLVRAGIQPGNLPLNVVDHEGATPLHYAVSNCDETFLLELLKSREAKKSINVADRKGRTPLFYAIIAKRIKNIEILLEHGADPNHINSFLITPLILACEEGFFPAVRMLIEAGANIDKRGTLEWLTPLFVSLGIENEEVSLYLLMSGANGQAKMRDGSTIAHAAAQSDKVSILRILSNQGISLNEPNLQGVRPIHLASQQGHHRILEYLLSEDISLESEVELPVTPSPSGELGWATMKGAKPIHFASMAGKIETVQWLLEHYANPESKFHNEFGVLNGAAQANSLSLIEQFKQYKLSQDINQLFSAITTAIQYDHVESVQMLYEIGIPINSEIIDGWNGLHLACKFGSVRTTHALLDQGAIPDIPNREGNQAIQVAASNNSVDQFWHMLIRSKADLNAVNGKGETLLHIAVKSGRLAHAMLLVHYGAPLDIQDHRGETPLHIAVKKGHLKLIGLLIGCGADSAKKTFMDEKTALELSTHPDISELIKRYDAIKAAAQGEETVLHLAIRAKLIEAVRVLCVDSDLNQRNSSGLTALHLAVEAESFSIVRMLLSRGADLEAEDNQGHTPLWKACLDKRHVLLTRILIKAGANRNHRNKSGQTIAHILNGMDFQEKNHMLELLKTE
jgi:ankyrin repeat protein